MFINSSPDYRRDMDQIWPDIIPAERRPDDTIDWEDIEEEEEE